MAATRARHRISEYQRDGLTFAVRDTGPPGGTPVVLLHGFPEMGGDWDVVADLLGDRGCRVLRPDQRGYSPGARPADAECYRWAS